MRNCSAFLAVLLLGACVAAFAEAEKPVQATLQSSMGTQTSTSTHHDKHEKITIIEGKPGKDGPPGKDGLPGATGAPGKQGKPGKDGDDGLNGRDAWVTLAWRSGAAAKINITSGEHAKHVVNQLTSTASCGEGEKAVACSCDTAQSSSAGVGFVAPKKTSYQGQDGGAFLGRANYITLVENALSGPANKAYKDACTCTGLYVATVRGKSSYQYKEVAEEEEDEYVKKPKYAPEKPKREDDYEKYLNYDKYAQKKHDKKPEEEQYNEKKKYEEEKYSEEKKYKKEKYNEKPKYDEEEEKYEEQYKEDKYEKKKYNEDKPVEKPKKEFFDAFKWRSEAQIQADQGVAVAAAPDATTQAANPDAQAAPQATKAAAAGYYVEDWTKKMPKWQAFEITATVTCQSVKLVPRPDQKDEYDTEDSYAYKKKSKKSEKYTEEKEYKDDDWFGKDGDKKDKYEEYAADDKEDF